MKYAREFDGMHRGEVLAAILVELPAQMVTNFEFDDATQVASFDVDDDLLIGFEHFDPDDVPAIDDVLDQLDAEIEKHAPAVNDATPTRRGPFEYLVGLFKGNGGK